MRRYENAHTQMVFKQAQTQCQETKGRGKGAHAYIMYGTMVLTRMTAYECVSIQWYTHTHTHTHAHTHKLIKGIVMQDPQSLLEPHQC